MHMENNSKMELEGKTNKELLEIVELQKEMLLKFLGDLQGLHQITRDSLDLNRKQLMSS